MKARRAVLFDLGGTLVEADDRSPGLAISEALGDASHAAAIDALVLRHSFATADELASRLATELGMSRTPLAEVAAAWDAAARPAVAIDGAVTCVAAVHATGALVGIVANVWSPAVLGARAGCPSVLAESDGWFASCELGSAKPGAALLQAALDAFEVKPAEVLVVGDDLATDVVPAIALGMAAVWLRRDDAGEGTVVTVDPHGAPLPIPADLVPGAALVARSLSDVRRIALTWLWSGRGARALTRPLTV